MWFAKYTLEQMNDSVKNTLVEHCGIKITEQKDDSLIGTMPVDERTKQPFGILHGGANCVLAETLGSMAANMTCDPRSHHAVGLSITTSHVKAVRNGLVKGIAKISHKGKTTQVWEIKTYNESEQLTSTSVLTMMIVQKNLSS